jgi:hypothetical protein
LTVELVPVPDSSSPDVIRTTGIRMKARPSILTLALAAATLPVLADCMQDLHGNVFCGRGQCMTSLYGQVVCSGYEDGGAHRTRYGEAVCGKGQCVRVGNGDLYCSTVEKGSARLDLYGEPRCEGACERASVDNCDTRPAGTR